MSLSSIEGYKLGADLDDVYQDFYNLGRIFQVEDRAEEVVNGMKEMSLLEFSYLTTLQMTALTPAATTSPHSLSVMQAARTSSLIWTPHGQP